MDGPKIYLVGRKNKTVKCHIYTPAREDTVSRSHLELTVTRDGRYFLNDRESVCGTFVKKDGRWKRISDGYAGLDDPIRLGSYETSVRQLLAAREPDPAAPKPEPPGGDKPYWDPNSGVVKFK